MNKDLLGYLVAVAGGEGTESVRLGRIWEALVQEAKRASARGTPQPCTAVVDFADLEGHQHTIFLTNAKVALTRLPGADGVKDGCRTLEPGVRTAVTISGTLDHV